MQIEHFINQIDLTLDPPTEEPLRQYYFIAKARTLVAQMEKEAGRKMTFCVNTFGCQMNARDSEKLCGILKCHRVSGDLKLRMRILLSIIPVRSVRMRTIKFTDDLVICMDIRKKNPHMMIALCGCMMQEPKVVEKIKTELSFRRFDLWNTQYFQVCRIAVLQSLNLIRWLLISGKIPTRL